MYVVIFTAQVHELDERYSKTAEKMRQLAFDKYACQGFNAVTEGNKEIAVSYWNDLQSIQQWKQEAEHLQAQSLGKKHWYQWYQVDVCKIERQYSHGDIQNSSSQG